MSLNLSNVTEVVTATVRWIRAKALNHRKFKKFPTGIAADYGDLVMFTAVWWFDAVRWLSCTTCLKRFYDLLPEIKTFSE